jgi:catechol 2,3-dioxygenase-like lactoylglutathione lyase family enzyme
MSTRRTLARNFRCLAGSSPSAGARAETSERPKRRTEPSERLTGMTETGAGTDTQATSGQILPSAGMADAEGKRRSSADPVSGRGLRLRGDAGGRRRGGVGRARSAVPASRWRNHARSVRPGSDDPWALPPGTCGAYVVTDDPDALYERADAAGADVIRPPSTPDYGGREFAVRDPEGNRCSFGTYRGEPRK